MNRALTVILLVSLAALVWFSHHLTGIRIYHADESQNVAMARIIATGQTKAYYAEAGILQAGVLSWLARGATQSVDILVSARFVMLEVFWLNIVLIALATGERILSRRGLLALIGAATLAPLWDFGFEIRADNLLLSGVLLLWGAVRIRPKGLQPFVIAGALTGGLPFIALKGIVFALPISAAILAFPPPGQRTPRWKLALAWAAGALGMFAIIRVGYGVAGLWDVYAANLRMGLEAALGGYGMGPGEALSRLLTQTPLLLAALTAGLVTVALDLRRRGKKALTWDGPLPEALLFVWALVALLLNPAPEPYKLLHVAPFAILLAFRYGTELLEENWGRAVLCPVLVALLVFAHFVPFGVATWRHLEMTNYHQEARMRLAEEVTNPAKDAIYDGIGMVPTRPFIGFNWLLPNVGPLPRPGHGGLHLRGLLAGRPAAVLMPNYRTDRLPAEDQGFFREHYVSLTDDFWVLGKVLPAGGGTFEVIHPGRYRISSLEGSDLAGTYPEGLAGLMAPEVDGSITGTLDGVPLTKRPVELAVGTHRIETRSDCQPVVVWVGPGRDRIGRLGDSDHRYLFVKWY